MYIFTIFNKCSACSSNAPAKMITKLVPSPTSCSCIWDANTMILAAGCSIFATDGTRSEIGQN